MTRESLKELRDRLKNRDEKIVDLLNERARISLEIGKIKKSQGLNIYDPSQENRVYHYLNEINEGPLPEGSLKEIFTEILSASRVLQTPVSVAYLGPEASFTHAAAVSHFGKSASFSPQSTIFDVFDQIERRRASWGVVPVENSLEGTVKMTLDRLTSTPLSILSEVFLRINHSLLSTRNGLDEIKRVYSHPQALAQCQEWLRKNLPGCPLHGMESTAKAAQKVLEDGEGAAIGSSNAASIYGLNIISEGIEDHPSNVTRFLVIGRGENKRTGRDKTSIFFGCRHMPGALCHSLEPFAGKEINLVKIESYPIRERMWEYLFFVDFNGHVEEEKIKECLKDLQGQSTFVKILGSYPMGDTKS
ncbi:MAG: prephenate dehydratase [Deltaproteobacteria bacterium]|nr:prephenate dehydratase [Deltaproteobacteria bacterium]MBW2648714.1 prephenate dehydratase [Deltaproteobacteria bacterium]